MLILTNLAWIMRIGWKLNPNVGKDQMGKNLHGTIKDLNVGTKEKEAKGKEQGLSKEELPSKPLDALDPLGGHKGQKVS